MTKTETRSAHFFGYWLRLGKMCRGVAAARLLNGLVRNYRRAIVAAISARYFQGGYVHVWISTCGCPHVDRRRAVVVLALGAPAGVEGGPAVPAGGAAGAGSGLGRGWTGALSMPLGDGGDGTGGPCGVVGGGPTGGVGGELPPGELGPAQPRPPLGSAAPPGLEPAAPPLGSAAPPGRLLSVSVHGGGWFPRARSLPPTVDTVDTVDRASVGPAQRGCPRWDACLRATVDTVDRC